VSEIGALISKLCPEGVPHKKLSELATTVSGLSGKVKSDFGVGNGRYVTYKQVFNNITVDCSTADYVFVGPGERQNQLHIGDVLFTGSSESVEELGMSSVVVEEPTTPLFLNSFCFALRFYSQEVIHPQFSKFLFRSLNLRREIQKSGSGVTRINISKSKFMQMRIPIPPMEVQLEIVRILDAMTSLQAELQAELEARRLQYEHYQHEVFDQLDGAGVQSVAVKDLGRWYGGGTPSKGRSDYWVDGTIPWISPKDMGGSVVTYTEDHITEAAVRNSATKLVPANAVALVARSSILDHTLPIAFVPSPSALNQDMKAVIAADGIEPRYVFHVLRANRARMLRTVRRSGGSVASLDSQKLWKFEVPVPGAEEQRRIIDFMDRFDLLTNDLSVGLPAELTARRKQYEYYRDKLLTFEELVA
jgi:type I restriction enzyme S subunit